MFDPIFYVLVGFALAFVTCWYWQRQDADESASTINALVGVAEHWERKAEEYRGEADAASDLARRTMKQAEEAYRQREYALQELNAMRAATFREGESHGYDVPDDRAG